MQKRENNQNDILVVDDISSNLDLIGNILLINNYSPRFAKNGLEALQEIQIKLPDLIFLDISMPEMDGYELCEILKSKEKTKDIPIIFLTAFSNTPNLVRAFQVGGQDYVTKPFKPEELLSRARTHIELKEKKEQVEAYNKKLLEMNEEQLRLNKILHEQKKVIEQKNNDLTSSLEYAQIIQNSLLPSAEPLKEYFSDVFLINMPKDIVSGDFFFFYKLPDENKLLVVVADCTGHGVPGALISVLGTSLVNKIIINDKYTKPESILNELDKAFNRFLKSNENVSVSNDGMDMAITLFDFDADKLYFSGAKRPIYFIRNNDLKSVRGSIHSVGGYADVNKTFKKNTIDLIKGDVFYLFSDGYADQFGGKKNKKLSTERFKELLIKNHNKPVKKQQEELVSFFNNWKANNEQIDDVLVLGIKL